MAERRVDESGLLDAVGPNVDEKSFLAGESTPLFVGSALTNFGVRHLLDAVVDLAPPPSHASTSTAAPRRSTSPFSAFVFKVQANMDPAHRDRLAFARICSGRFERGMSGDLRPHRPRADHEVRHHGIRSRPRDRRGGLPRRRRRPRQRHRSAARRHPARRRRRSSSRRSRASRPRSSPPRDRSTPAAPSSSAAVSSNSTRRAWCRCSATPTPATPLRSSPPSAQLQFDVFGYRLASEFDAPAEILAAGYQAIRLTDAASAPAAARDRRHPHPAPVRRRARRPVREPLPAARLESRRARADPRADRRRRRPRCLTTRQATSPLCPGAGGADSSSTAPCAGGWRPGRGEVVDGDDALDHVGEHGGPRPAADADRHHATVRPAAERAIDAHDPRRAAEAGSDEATTAGLAGEGARRVGEVDGGRGLHGVDCARGVRGSGPGAAHPLGTVLHVQTGGELTPVQQRTLEALRRTDSPVVFDPAFVAELRSDAATAWPSSPSGSRATS